MKRGSMATAFQRFTDRAEAGKVLASALSSFYKKIDTVVLALPRGGVPVAHEVAEALSLPMDLWLVRKLGVPGHEEFAMGALAEGDIIALNDDVIAMLDIHQAAIQSVVEKEQAELRRRSELYRENRPRPDVDGKTVIIVDDGLATGATMRAAILSLRQAGAVWVIAAAPVGSPSTCEELEKDADEVICPFRPQSFQGVGQWYRDFSQTTDSEVRSYLSLSNPK